MPLVELRGNTDLLMALRKFTPDLHKALKSELRRALMPVVSQAKGFVTAEAPMSHWEGRSFSEAKFPTYNASIIKSGIVLRIGADKPNKFGFNSVARIINQSKVGAIYEMAGRNGPQDWVGPGVNMGSNKVSHSVNKGAGAQFIKNLPPLTSSLQGRGRLIYKAWAANKGKPLGAAMKAIDTATTLFYARNSKSKFERAA